MNKEKYWQRLDALLKSGASAIVPDPSNADPQGFAVNLAFVQSSLALMRSAYTDLHGRWKDAGRSAVSKHLWRWEPVLGYSEPNHKREVGLERQIAKCDELTWTNQVPTSSGLFGSGGRRSAIDLAHRFAPDAFELIELKLKSDTPEFAAREIIVHGLLFLLARNELGHLPEFADKPLLTARTLHLQVLAPFAYYERDVRWLEALLNRGIAALCQEIQPDVTMSFAFTSFPKWFSWPKNEAQLGEAVAGRHPRW